MTINNKTLSTFYLHTFHRTFSISHRQNHLDTNSNKIKSPAGEQQQEEEEDEEMECGEGQFVRSTAAAAAAAAAAKAGSLFMLDFSSLLESFLCFVCVVLCVYVGHQRNYI